MRSPGHDNAAARKARSHTPIRPRTSNERSKPLKAALRGFRKKWSELADGTGSGQPDMHQQTIEDVLKKVGEFLGEFDQAPVARLSHFAEELRGPLAQFLREWFPVKKILIAVHGIGDQFNFATIQSVAYRVCDYVGQPAAMPLGRFHGNIATVTRAYLPDPDRDPPRRTAGSPRSTGPTCPASPRLRSTFWKSRRIGRGPWLNVWNFALSTTTRNTPRRTRSRHATTPNWSSKCLDEMIQAVVVVDRLPFLAGSAGFNLKKLLIDYLNDVQVVTEFDNYREELLDIFRSGSRDDVRILPGGRTLLHRHSEGTVITFMGLLKGLSSNAEWAKKVKGLMTIGSPLNKHVRLWPELFSEFVAPDNLPDGMQPIQWRNYYDYGDPIAYNLRSTRRWMTHHRWMPFFNFKDPQDEPVEQRKRIRRDTFAVRLASGSEADEFGGDIGFSPLFLPRRGPLRLLAGSRCLRPLPPNRRRPDRAVPATYVPERGSIPPGPSVWRG